MSYDYDLTVSIGSFDITVYNHQDKHTKEHSHGDKEKDVVQFCKPPVFRFVLGKPK